MKEKPKYQPTKTDRAMAEGVDDLLTALMHGDLVGLGVCATTKEGRPVYFYLDKLESHDSLSNPMSKLMGLYTMNRAFNKQITAPKSNRSFMVH